MKSCKDCLHKKFCPHMDNTEAERCKSYESRADYIKVVKCKDCEFRQPLGYENKGQPAMWCIIQSRITGEDEYCNNGVRKEQQ